jgi:thiol:disulfide interchange protein
MRLESRCKRALAALLLLAAAQASAQTIGYDPAADPFEQLAAAEAEARAQDKPILVIAGGEWCIWCHYLDRFLHDEAELDAALHETFVVVKAYYGDETDNQAFFDTLPEAIGYPHFWILAADGSVLESQNTLPLEDGDKSYDPARFRAFIERWAGATPKP